MKNKIPVLFFYCLFSGISFSAFSGKIEKANESLMSFNYFEARNLFLKTVDDYPAISNFGLSVIYYRSDNPFHNTDSAYNRVQASLDAYEKAEKGELKKLDEFKISRDSIVRLKSAISQFAFKVASDSGTISAFEHFIDEYKLSPELTLASRMRDSLAFEDTRDENSSESYQLYMNKYPGSYLFPEAKARYDKTLYDESVFDGTELSYANFIEAYPQNPHVQDAMQKVYSLATGSSNDPQVYHKFIVKYPGNILVEDAWQRIYDLSMTSYDEASLLKFKETYADYPDKEKLAEDLRLIKITLLPFTQGGFYGLMDTNGSTVVEPRYDQIGKFNDGIAMVTRSNKTGYVNKSGDEIVPPYYDDAEDFHNSLAIVGEKGKYGVINRNGKMVIPLSYDEIGDFSEGKAAVFNGDKYGYINRSGVIVIPFRYESAGEFSNGLAICSNDDNYGLIDTLGNVVLPFQYDALQFFSKDFIKVTKEEKSGLIRLNGSLFLPVEYDEIGSFSNNRSVIINNGKLGFISREGKIITPITYDAGKDALIKSMFQDNYATVRKNNKYGVVDTSGKLVIPTIYEDLRAVGDSLFAFRQKGKWGIRRIQSDKPVMAPKMDLISDCADGNCIGVQKGAYGMFEYKGNILLPFGYDNLIRLRPGLYLGRRSGKWGVLDDTLGEIISFQYDQYQERDPGFFEFSNATENIWLEAAEMRTFRKN